MIGLNSGLLGIRRTSGRGAAIGSWALNEQVIYQRKNHWIGDPYFANNSLLLHMNNLADSSLNNFSVTVSSGNPQILTNNYKFDGASAYFNGAGDGLSTPGNAAFNFGTNSFTVEAWVYISQNSSLNDSGVRLAQIASCLVGNPASPGWGLYINGSNATTGTGLVFEHRPTSGSSYFYAGSQSISQSSWNHFAVSRSGSVLYLFINGILLGQPTLINQNIFAASTLWIGRQSVGGYTNNLNGYIDDLRITKDVARYTANFTVPSSPFPNG